jgi:flavin-dependent dehydrogenase
VVVAGAGPAGLRAAQILAEAGREVIVVERQPQVGPKTCAGGLTPKAVRELEALGLPACLGLESRASVSLDGAAPRAIDGDSAKVRTVSRCALGRLQAEWTRRAGATILTGTSISAIDLDRQQVRVGERSVRYQHLIGADGSASRVRRALGLPVSRAVFAAEFNVPRHRASELLLQSDSPRLASGYFWVFPHIDYTSVGAIAPTRLVRPRALRVHLERYAAECGIRTLPQVEAATLEVEFVGFHFGQHVHLVGDAAGVASSLTGEGIYSALITGEEVARQVIAPKYRAWKTESWFRTKRAHDFIVRLWRSRRFREASFSLLDAGLQHETSRRRLVSFFIA